MCCQGRISDSVTAPPWIHCCQTLPAISSKCCSHLPYVMLIFMCILIVIYQGSHKNLKTEFHDFSMTPILTWFQIWLWLSHNMHDNHKLESCHSHENKDSMTFPWLPWQRFFPGFSMTVGTLFMHMTGNNQRFSPSETEHNTNYLGAHSNAACSLFP